MQLQFIPQPIKDEATREFFTNDFVKKWIPRVMGHSDISVTMNVYTHFGFDDAEEELKRMEEFRKAQAEVEKKNEKPMTKRMFKAI